MPPSLNTKRSPECQGHVGGILCPPLYKRSTEDTHVPKWQSPSASSETYFLKKC